MKEIQIYVKNFANSHHPFRRAVRALPLFIKHNSVMDIPGKHKRQIKLWINSVTSLTNGLFTWGMRQLPIQLTAQTPAKNALLPLVQKSWSQGFHQSLEFLLPKIKVQGWKVYLVWMLYYMEKFLLKALGHKIQNSFVIGINI